jgi:hypothetical protein
MVRVPSHRRPTHPGEMLLEKFLEPMDLTHSADWRPHVVRSGVPRCDR